MMQPEPGITSTAPSGRSFQAPGPSSVSHCFSFCFAHASRFEPSNKTIAPGGGFVLGAGAAWRALETAKSRPIAWYRELDVIVSGRFGERLLDFFLKLRNDGEGIEILSFRRQRLDGQEAMIA